MDKSKLHDVYRFWFGEALASPDDIDPDRIRFWMRQKDETDRLIRDSFGHLIDEAAAEPWDFAALTREEALALVVLFDQFPRNIHRTSGNAYAYDHLALDLARRLTAHGWEQFNAMERFLLSLPFVHHEDLADQDHAVMVSAAEAVRAPHCFKDGQRFTLDQAIRHRAVIQKFGRFPHRNAMLGRESTADELAFMAEHGRGF